MLMNILITGGYSIDSLTLALSFKLFNVGLKVFAGKENAMNIKKTRNHRRVESFS